MHLTITPDSLTASLASLFSRLVTNAAEFELAGAGSMQLPQEVRANRRGNGSSATKTFSKLEASPKTSENIQKHSFGE